jgi:type IV secretory pathway TraG/TraD family ATPase VirD4
MPRSKLAEPAWVPKGYHECTTFSRKWKLKDKLLRFSPFSKAFTLEHAFRGIKIYGSTGSGKTSGVARDIAAAYLDHGFGGLVLCAKNENDELNNWTSIAKEVNRSKSIVHFGPKNKKIKLCFNVIEFIRNLTENKMESQTNLVKFLKLAANNFEDSKISSTDSFWDGVTDQFLFHLLTITFSANPGKELTFERLDRAFKIVQKDAETINGFIIDKNTKDIKKAIDFFTNEFPAINEKTRSIIIAAVSSLLYSFNTGILAELFGDVGNINPKWIFSGAVIVVNVPTLEYYEIGRIANRIWKYAFQLACMTRKSLNGFMRPVFLWADEAQEFIHQDDAKFQSVARQTRCSTVYLTQNIAGLRLNLGSGAVARDMVESIEANLLTSIFHQNTHFETNKYASEVIGNKEVKVTSETSKGIFSAEVSKNVSYKMEPIFMPESFKELKTGGNENGRVVESLVVTPGSKRFFDVTDFTFKDWYKIYFKQGQNNGLRIKSLDQYDVDFEGFLDQFLTEDKN